MKTDDFSPDLFFRELYKNRIQPFEKKNLEDIPAKSLEIKEKLKKVLAFEKIPNKTAELSPVVLSEEKRKNYTIKALSVEICKNWKMLCYLLVPESPNGFGVVAVPGHGYGVRQIIRQGKNDKYRRINFLDSYQKNFAEELALRGNTVIAFEPVAFGKARLKKDMKKPFYISSCETVSMHSLMYGFSCASLRIYQAVRCVDILEKEGLKHFGIMGISGGGLIALYASLIEDRIEKTVVSGYINTFGKSVFSMWHCTDNYIPGLLEIGDMYDFASALAPKKLLLECGRKDKLFPIAGAETAIEKISGVYEKIGAKDNFIYDIHPGKHSVSGIKSFDFFS
ncbi:MAG: hypothetical protein IKL10_07930 [Clostridia bacterium]|nr:hypothetical protein [Clostridia bacterium]